MEPRLRLRRFNKTCGDETDIVKLVQRYNKGFSDAVARGPSENRKIFVYNVRQKRHSCLD